MINTWNEYDLHNSLKSKIAGSEGLTECKIAGKIVDVFLNNQIIEIQTANFSSLRKKLQMLINLYPIKLVYPLVREKRVTTIDEDGEIIRSRKSSKQGKFIEIFDELIYITDLFLTPGFTFEIIQVDIEEIRADDGKGSWRRKGISIKNRILKESYPGRIIRNPFDLFLMLNLDKIDQIDSKNLSEFLKIKIYLARKVLYFFRHTGVIQPAAKKGNRIIYQGGEGY